MNYIYGTWSVLCALNAAGIDARSRRKCAARSPGSCSIQNADGGWGEDGDSYELDYTGHERGAEHRRRRPPGRCSG